MAEQRYYEIIDVEVDGFTSHPVHNTNQEHDGFNVHLPPTVPTADVLPTADVHQTNDTNDTADHELQLQTEMQPVQTSHVRNHSDSSGSHSPREESSPYGSPGNQKNEAMALNCGNEDHRHLNRLFTRGHENYEIRLATFVTWYHPTLAKEVLAEAGFYYLGESDKVFCSKCGQDLHSWEPNDDPRNEHYKHFGKHCF